MSGRIIRSTDFRLILLTIIFPALALKQADAQHIKFLATPEDGIQPQAVVDNQGVAHLIYYQGDPKGGDIFYVHRDPGQEKLSRPIPVNSRPHAAMALGTIRGAQMAIGKNGRPHVVWGGMGSAASGGNKSGADPAPLFYTRLDDSGTAFEPERNIITYAYGLDGGSSVAADPHGKVYVVWHAPGPRNTNGDAGRTVFVSSSTNEGKTFTRETQATTESTGACACCSLCAFANNAGAVSILYRAAGGNINRDETLLVSKIPSGPFETVNLHAWKATTCPMSSSFLSEGQTGTLAAWETAGRVYFAHLNPNTPHVSEPICPPGGAGRKYPVAVSNKKGETLLVWAEGTAWGKGGSVDYQVFDKNDQPTLVKGCKEGLKTWSFAAAFADPDGNFTIIY